MALPPYMTTTEKVSYYGLRIFVGAGAVVPDCANPGHHAAVVQFRNIFQLSDARVFDAGGILAETMAFSPIRALDWRVEAFGHRRRCHNNSGDLPGNPGSPWPVTLQHSGPRRDHGGADFADDRSGDHFGNRPVFLLCLYGSEWHACWASSLRIRRWPRPLW